MTLIPGTLLNNRYRIVSILGQGGMGAVYRAIDENLNISVAVKENLFLSDDYARQFQREANILASLRHPNLPRVGDYFALPGQGQYLIMDFIEGEDLRQRIERLSYLLEQDVILIGAAMCDAFTYLHTRKFPIVHRDIKPGNIKITPESEIILVDFGLAKVMLGEQATTTGARAMTPGYSPPEQYGTARTDARSDIYSLGATLYAALTGIIPEDGLARATGKSELTPIRQLRPKVSRKLATVIEKALEVEPGERYQTAEDFKFRLLEAGELTQSYQERLRVSPPPLDSQEEKPETQAEGGESSQPPPTDLPSKSKPIFPKAERSSRHRRQMTLLRFIIGFLVIGLIGAGFILRPDLGDAVIARFFTTHTSQPIAAQVNTTAPQETALSTGQPVNRQIEPSTPSSTNTPAVTKTVEIQSPEPTSALPLVGGGSGEVAFTSDRTGVFQIWIMNSDGSQQRQLSNLPEGACQPAWSPDGQKLAVISPCKAVNKLTYDDAYIYILNADGKDPQLLPVSAGGDFDPAWDPEGKRLAFSSTRSGRAQIFVYDFVDETLKVLSDTQYPDIQPSWNPSGKQLAIARRVSPSVGQHKILLISDAGQTQLWYTPKDNLNDLWPDWTPDGEAILFSRSKIPSPEPWLVSLRYEDRGTNRDQRIPSQPVLDLGPVAKAKISPDGRWLVVESWPDGNNHDIYLMDTSGDNRLRLTTDPGYDSSPVWRPAP